MCPYSIANTARRIAQLIRERRHAGRAHVIGISEGAQVEWPKDIASVYVLTRVSDNEYWAVANLPLAQAKKIVLLHYLNGTWSEYAPQ